MKRPYSTLQFSHHARKRLYKRDIATLLVREAVRKGSRRTQGDRQVFLLRSLYGFPLVPKLVVVLEGCWVITTYWREAPAIIGQAS